MDYVIAVGLFVGFRTAAVILAIACGIAQAVQKLPKGKKKGSMSEESEVAVCEHQVFPRCLQLFSETPLGERADRRLCRL
jgi:hypothetical protein